MQTDDESTAAERRDAEVERMTIGAPDLLNSQIELAEYDPAWPEQYAELERTIRDALGEQVRLIEHCGSTSVPGLPAKPRIDIVLAVPDSSSEADYVPHLEANGFWLRIREPDWFEHRVFKFAEPDVNLHVFTEGCSEIEKMLVFRDWLRSHPDDRDLYASEKRRLAAQTWKYTQHYADAKSTVVQEILARAGWTAEPTR
jgi:GrpB-like predicted nucleotidyltransferase (UPF0157 family)